MILVDVKTSGPVFDYRADAVTDKMTTDIAEDVAQKGYNMIQARLPQVLRHPTGRYQGAIRISNLAFASRVIHDSNIIYGPWLEGVGERNRTTRFKGYFTFRLVGQELERQAGIIAEHVVDSEIGALR